MIVRPWLVVMMQETVLGGRPCGMGLAGGGSEASAPLAVNATGLTAGHRAKGLAAELNPFFLTFVVGTASQPCWLPCSASCLESSLT